MSAPASMAVAAFRASIPPMAATGRPEASRARAIRSRGARTAPGFVDEANRLPMPM
jgi:hypothetical protein